MTLSSIHPHRLVPLITAMGLILWVLPAQAGYFVWCTEEYEASPADGSIDVPLNPMLLYPSVYDAYQYTNPGFLELVDEDGNIVDAWGTDLVEGECFTAGFPEEPLEPNTVYEVLLEGELLASFTTGEDFDEQAPAFVAGEDDADPGLRFEYESDEPVVLVSTSRSDGVDNDFFGITPGEAVVDFTEWTMGIEPGTSLLVRFYDASGNWDEVTVDKFGTSPTEDGPDGEPDGGTCALASTNGMPRPSVLLTMLFLLAGLVARRR